MELLEQLDDPWATMIRTRSLLSHHGIVVLRVPNPEFYRQTVLGASQSFQISCGTCHFCKRMETALCDTTNPEGAEQMQKAYGQAAAGLFGYSHLYGGYPGGQAQYVRVPCADFGAFKVPESLSDEQVFFLTDIFPTGFMAAENCGHFSLLAPGQYELTVTVKGFMTHHVRRFLRAPSSTDGHAPFRGG